MRQQPEWSRGRVLGRGSTATVSLASAPSSGGELFAVKSAELARSEFLQREGRIHSAIRPSPRVVSYLGFDVTDEPTGAYYNLFLEYAPGGSLSDEIKKRQSKLGEIDIRAYTRDIVLGLAHLHSMKLAHCDIKGQNVLIGRDGRAKIADFGCARFVDGDTGKKGQFMGTPTFMAPEVARGQEQGMAADIWAAGCTVIEMATGRPPWPDATNAVALLHRIAFSGDAPAMPESMSEEGKDFLGKCLAREPEERWTAAELLQHPFLSSSVPDSDSDSDACKWTSPKSTLDQSFWDSESDKDEFTPNKPEAIQELLSHGAGPDWTWDDDWLTIRDDSIAAVAVADDDETVGGDSTRAPAGTSSQGSIIISTTISINQGITGGELRPVTDVNCESDAVISPHNCDHDTVTALCLSNWIFPFNFQLSICFCPFSLCCVVSRAVRKFFFFYLFISPMMPSIGQNSWANENRGTRGGGSTHIFFYCEGCGPKKHFVMGKNWLAEAVIIPPLLGFDGGLVCEQSMKSLCFVHYG